MVNQPLFDPPKSPICGRCRGYGFIHETRRIVMAGKVVDYDYSKPCPECRPAQKGGES